MKKKKKMSVLLFCRDDKTNDQIIMNLVPSDSKFQDLYSGINFFGKKKLMEVQIPPKEWRQHLIAG